MDEALLPAVVLGIDTPIGLAIIRSLGEHGVKVHGIGRDSAALGMASRYLQHGFVRADGEAALIQQLIDLSRALGGACLFAISEGDIEMLNRHRARLDGYQLMFADDQRMQRVLNKERTYAAAAAVGVRMPRTEQPISLEQVLVLISTLRFPVVLKWANPNDVARALSAAGLALDKTHYCYSADELIGYLQPYESVGIYPLIQEYCAGYGLGQFILMHEGKAHYAFQHRRVHEWPPEGGFSSLCESVSLDAHQTLMTQSIALLRALDWEGIAMVEYRYDPVAGESALMEINGRFWGSLPLACHAGAGFPWLSYKLFGLGQQVEQGSYRAGVRCRFMIPETKRLVRILFKQGAIADRTLSFQRLPELFGYLADFIRPQTKYFVFAWRDPMPFFADFMNTVRTGLRRVLGRKDAVATTPIAPTVPVSMPEHEADLAER